MLPSTFAGSARVKKPAVLLAERDIEADLITQLQAADGQRRYLRIAAGGTKDFYGNPVEAESVLDVAPHQGIVAYEPSELAITVRAGTPLAAVEALLGANGQQLPFEPPHFGPTATIGGMVAAGLSGPRRPYAASVRDAVLGVRIINGRGQVLSFGGRVMKNVAGYDVSRLTAGSLGVLGVLLDVSLKVTPKPVADLSLVREASLKEALGVMRAWAGRSLNLTASAWVAGRLYARLCGSEEALLEGRKVIGGAPLEDGDRFWRDLREHHLGEFEDPRALWRLSVAPAAQDLTLSGEQIVEWGGALRWLRSDAGSEAVREAAQQAGGHATLFRSARDGARCAGSVFTPLAPALMRYHRNLKQAFDPNGILNPGRMYPEF
jgi:glycolate oxidase FAD binding subunit